VAQVRREVEGKRYTLHILREIVTVETSIQVFGAKVVAECASLFPGVQRWRDYGDYSANQRTATGTIIGEMRKLGITLTTVPTGPGGVMKGIELVQALISGGSVEVDLGCGLLLKALRNNYTRDDVGEPNQEHPWEDLCDALRYLVMNVFELESGRDGSKVVVMKKAYRGTGRPEAGDEPGTPMWVEGVDGRVEYARLEGYRGACHER
jgi:hypothetical protein